VHRFVRVLWRKSNDGFSNVLVLSQNIGISVVKNVVLNFPIDVVGTQMDFQLAVEAIMTIYQEITGKELDTKKYGIQ